MPTTGAMMGTRHRCSDRQGGRVREATLKKTEPHHRFPCVAARAPRVRRAPAASRECEPVRGVLREHRFCRRRLFLTSCCCLTCTIGRTESHPLVVKNGGVVFSLHLGTPQRFGRLCCCSFRRGAPLPRLQAGVGSAPAECVAFLPERAGAHERTRLSESFCDLRRVLFGAQRSSCATAPSRPVHTLDCSVFKAHAQAAAFVRPARFCSMPGRLGGGFSRSLPHATACGDLGHLPRFRSAVSSC